MRVRMPVCIHSVWIEDPCEKCGRTIDVKLVVPPRYIPPLDNDYIEKKAKGIEKWMAKISRKQSALAIKREDDYKQLQAYATETRAMIVNSRKDIENIKEELCRLKSNYCTDKIASLIRQAEMTKDKFSQACNEVSSFRNSFGNALDSVAQKVHNLEMQIKMIVSGQTIEHSSNSLIIFQE